MVGLAIVVSACSSGGSHTTAAPATTLPADAVTVDVWNPPVLSGPAGPTTFCAALTGLYRHMALLPRAADRTVGEHFLADYVSYAPTAIAYAPPSIHSAAASYMSAVAGYLSALERAGLDPAKLAPGSLAPLSGSGVASAGSAVISYSKAVCGYTISAS